MNNEQYIEAEGIKNFCINSNRETRLRASISQDDIIKDVLNEMSVQELIDENFD